MKRLVKPQYLVEPQDIEGHFDGEWQSNLVLLFPTGVSRDYACLRKQSKGKYSNFIAGYYRLLAKSGDHIGFVF
jgi:hypothetical protein